MEHPQRPGDVVEDAGDVDSVCDGREVAIDALFVRLVVVRSDDKQSIHADLLVGEALFQHGLGAVGARACDDRHAAANVLDHEAANLVVLLMRHRGALAGGAEREDAVGAVFDLEFDEAVERFEVDASVVVEWRYERDDRPFKMLHVHRCSFLLNETVVPG